MLDGRADVFVLDAQCGVPAARPDPAHGGGAGHALHGVPGGNHGQLRRDRHTVHRPSRSSLLRQARIQDGPWHRSQEPPHVSFQVSFLGVFRPTVGRHLHYLRHLESHRIGHRRIILNACVSIFLLKVINDQYLVLLAKENDEVS